MVNVLLAIVWTVMFTTFYVIFTDYMTYRDLMRKLRLERDSKLLHKQRNVKS